MALATKDFPSYILVTSTREKRNQRKIRSHCRHSSRTFSSLFIPKSTLSLHSANHNNVYHACAQLFALFVHFSIIFSLSTLVQKEQDEKYFVKFQSELKLSIWMI